MDIGFVDIEAAARVDEGDERPPSFDEIMRCIREDLDLRPGAIENRQGDSEGASGPRPWNEKILRALSKVPHNVNAPRGIPTDRRFARITPRPVSGATTNRSPARQSRIALLTVSSSRGERGGAERLYEGLQSALMRRGAVLEQISLTSDESSFDNVLRSYLRAYDVDLSAFDGIISTKAPSYAIRHRNHVCLLLHTMRVFYDMFEETFALPTPDLLAQRNTIRQIDTAALRRPSLGSLFVVGAEVRERLQAFNGIDSEILHHPTSLRGLRTGEFRYLLLPGRLHRWKRVDLAVRAVCRMRHSVELFVSGVGEDEARLRDEASGMTNVHFVGHVNDAELTKFYADALAVLYCPVREDYGLVPVEAFLSGKPVVTCSDSGEPARLVADGVNGFVCEPDAQSIADRLDWLVENRTRAAEMGRRGRETVAHIDWETVCNKLLGALGCQAKVL